MQGDPNPQPPRQASRWRPVWVLLGAFLALLLLLRLLPAVVGGFRAALAALVRQIAALAAHPALAIAVALLVVSLVLLALSRRRRGS